VVPVTLCKSPSRTMIRVGWGIRQTTTFPLEVLGDLSHIKTPVAPKPLMVVKEKLWEMDKKKWSMKAMNLNFVLIFCKFKEELLHLAGIRRGPPTWQKTLMPHRVPTKEFNYMCFLWRKIYLRYDWWCNWLSRYQVPKIIRDIIMLIITVVKCSFTHLSAMQISEYYRMNSTGNSYLISFYLNKLKCLFIACCNSSQDW
jgi:hypothetical protein